MLNNIATLIKQKIKQGDTNSPCLFLGNNLELTNSKIKDFALSLLKDFSIPSSYLFILEDNWEKIKIKDLKEFIKFSNSKSCYPFQIFLIENIYRLTLTSANSLLKLFEEPWFSNIIFLTSSWENWILDTILSRVNIVNINTWKNEIKKDEFYYSLIDNYKINNSPEIFSYFFRNKLEKEEYIKFLENIIIYYKNNIWKSSIELNWNFLSELDDDINGIKQNNVNAKYIIDKWLLKI